MLFFGVTVLPTLSLFVWAYRATVVTNENGLRWRHFGGWQEARWDEIEDYFIVSGEKGSGRTNYLRFQDGRTLQLSLTLWSDQAALLALVAQKATHAKPSGWLLRGKEGTITGQHAFRYKSKKRREHFEADEQSVTYFDGHTLHSAAWSDVLALHDPQVVFQRSVYTLETRDWGASFTSALKEHTLLRAMVRQYAPHLSIARLRIPPRELLVPTERDGGKRIFHYQTRTNRRTVGLWLCTGLVWWVLAGLVWWVLRGLEFEDDNRTVFALLALGGASLFTWVVALWSYKAERIIVDRESVTQVRVQWQRRVFFEQIKEIETGLERDTVVTHNGERPISWRHSLANVVELREEIEKHLRARS
ncbi:hypothetical protein [Armatimonas sp.]|uniref:hypothetical protein n=1 Tax=Armatimonas sp. TaxID=1872638 RepID=UPI00375340E9